MYSVRLLLIVLACCLMVAVGATKRYDEYKLVRVMNPGVIPPTLLQHFNPLHRHGGNSAQHAEEYLVPTAALAEAARTTSALNFTVLHDNIQQMIDIERATSSLAKARSQITDGSSSFHSSFHDYDDFQTFFNSLASRSNGALLVIPDIGKSVESRPIMAVVISGTVPTLVEKPTVYLHCLLHAREWIAGATCAYIADTLVSSYKTNPRVTALLDRVRILMVPVANPDGLHYTFTMDRMLRKNLHGVDLNRNWPFMWGQIGSSSDPSDEIYHGPSAASEPETQSILRLLSSQKKIIGSIDFHSYGQDILRPFGHTTVPPPDEARLAAVSERMSSAIRKVRGTYYRTAPSGSGLYMTSGTFDDYVYATYKAYSLTIELSPSDSPWDNGFIVEPSRIKSIGADVMPAVLEFAEFALASPLS